MNSTSTQRFANLLSIAAISVICALPATAEVAPDLSAAVIRTPPIERPVVIPKSDLSTMALMSKMLHDSAYIEGGGKIGTITDVVLDAENQAAVVVDVGAFLGTDQRLVAIPMSKIRFEADGKGIRIIAELTKAELQNAEPLL